MEGNIRYYRKKYKILSKKIIDTIEENIRYYRRKYYVLQKNILDTLEENIIYFRIIETMGENFSTFRRKH